MTVILSFSEDSKTF